MKLFEYLLVNKSITIGSRKATPRFFKIVLWSVLAIVILFILLLHYTSIFGKPLATSGYWKAVLYDE